MRFHRDRLAARAGASALGGRSGARRRFPLRRIRAGRRPPGVDDRRLCLCRRGRARLRQPCLAGRCARRETDYIGGGLVTDLPIEPFRTDQRPCLGAPAARHLVLRPHRGGAGRGRADAALGIALRRGGGVFGGAQPAGAGEPYRRERRRGRCQRAPVGADQFDALRVALRPLRQDHRPRHGRLVQDRRGDRGAAAGVADRLRQRAASPPGPRCGRAIRWSAPGSRCASVPAGPASLAASCMLQPHFQLDDVSATFRLVTDIAAPGSRRT